MLGRSKFDPFKMILKLFLLLLTLNNVISHNEDVHTVQYNLENFANELQRKNNFVMFFAPWCGHCQRMAPIWEQLAEMLNEDDSQIQIAKVDCTVDKELCADHDITGYPTLKFYKIGEKDGVKFKGTRDLPTLTAFINDQLGTTESLEKDISSTPESLHELTEDNFDKHVSKGKHFIKFYAPWCGHCQKLAPTWEELIQSVENDKTVSVSKVDCTLYRSICNQFDIQGYPTILWIEDGKKVADYQGQRSFDNLKQYINTMVGVEQVNNESKQSNQDVSSSVTLLTGDDFQAGIKTGISFVKFFAPWCGHCKRLALTWEDLGKKFVSNSNVHIIKVDCTAENSKELCNEQEVDGFPTLVLFKDAVRISEYKGSRLLKDLSDFVSSHMSHDEL